MGIFRLSPQGQPQDYKTYSIKSPVSTHWRQATCEEVECEAYLNGWITRVPTGSDLETMVRSTGRPFVEHREGAETVFTFQAGTQCFRVSTHKVSLERPAFFIVRGGDWRGNPLQQQMTHKRPDDWVEDFAEHQQKLSEQIAKG